MRTPTRITPALPHITLPPPPGADPRQAPGTLRQLHTEEEGLATAEYGIVMLAAVAFAGLLTAVLTSDTVQGLLQNVVQSALSH